MSLGGAGAGPAVGLPEVLSLAFSEGGRRLTNQKYSLSPILASFIILSTSSNDTSIHTSLGCNVLQMDRCFHAAAPKASRRKFNAVTTLAITTSTFLQKLILSHTRLDRFPTCLFSGTKQIRPKLYMRVQSLLAVEQV